MDSTVKTTSTDGRLVCSTCGSSFTSVSNLNRHAKIHLGVKPFVCETCEKSFGRKSDLNRHKMTHGVEVKSKLFSCDHCGQVFSHKGNLQEHVKSKHSSGTLTSVKRKMITPNTKSKRMKQECKSSSIFKTLMFYPDESNAYDLKVFQASLQLEIFESLQSEIRSEGAIKWYMVKKVRLERKSDENLEIIDTFFRSQCFIEMTEDNITMHIEEGYNKIMKSLEEFIQRGSGWILHKIRHLELKMAKYHPLAASSYIPLPPDLAAKKAVLNIKNDDDKCLIWCLLAHKMNLGFKDHPERVNHYTPFEHEVNLGDVKCPVPVHKIKIIEQLNNLRINVFAFENGEVCPLYISPREDSECINLLLIATEEQQHYCLIRNFSRLVGDLTKHKAQSYYCYRCLHRFTSEEVLKNHREYCKYHTIQVIKMPKPEENILEFTGTHLQHSVGYVIYADFESLLVPIASATPSSKNSYTEKTAYHMPCGYAYVIIGPDGKSFKPVKVYRGEDAVEHFLDRMMEEKAILSKELLEIKPLMMTEFEEKIFQEAKTCSICKKPLNSEKVRDHNHLTGAFRGAAHVDCNLNYKQPKSIPVIFHNLKNYDGHHIMNKLGKYKDHDIEVIAISMEKYISFRLKKKDSPVQLIFLDSFQFLPTSLEKLAKNLELSQFSILKENFPADASINLLIRKGVYPYEYFTCFKKFEETELPPSSAFYNTLADEFILDEDYEHALNIWNVFDMKTLGDYHDLYVKTDVLLLADVFQNFRKLCLQYYEIDCAHLFTSPGLAWQACLKMCETPLELLTDIDMLLLIEKGIRGGISMISERFAKANNPYLTDYDSNIPSSYIMYWDANNLYGWAMNQHLPVGSFEWAPVNNVDEEWILSLGDEDDYGYILEVDLKYSEQLHDLHNEYPLAPERMKITKEMLSPFAKSMCNSVRYIGTEKLIPNLYDKKNYVLHYRNLKLYLQLGLKISAIHKMIRFKQAPWLKKYILFNTEKRKNATSSFEKDFFKLLNNSVYGKTMENLRKRRNIVLCNNSKRAKKLVASPTFKAFKTYNEDLNAVEREKTSILMNRPTYVGFAILELSKLLMYDFHFNVIKKIYKEKATLLFTDTDSLTYFIETPDIYQDMYHYRQYFDFSDYPQDHFLYSNDNKKIIGKFKDELNSEPISEFAGLKSKMYSMKTETDEKKRAKGVCRRTVRQKIKHEDYVNCIEELKTFSEKQIRIEQDCHQLYTVMQNKVALSPFDDKRYILEKGISSLAYGHYKILNKTSSEQYCE